MVSIEQIRKLEQRVHAAVSRIQSLDRDNLTLRSQLAEYEQRLGELQKLVDAFKSDQAEIEAGIVSVLRHLDQLEDRVSEPQTPEGETGNESPGTAEAGEPSPASSAPDTPEEAEVSTDKEELDGEEDEEPELDIF